MTASSVPRYVKTLVGRLLASAPSPASGLTQEDLHDIDNVLARESATAPHLVYLGDKSVLWNSDRTAFVMYAVRGRSCVALGDPVGPRESIYELVEDFTAMCGRRGFTPVFYEASGQSLDACAECGLVGIKIGEEARVPLARFTLAGSRHKALRTALSRMEREGFSFRVVESSGVAPLLRELRDVSNEWLATKQAAEKGFSVGFFDEGYLARSTMAVIERDGRIEAFANLWLGAGREEMAADLMRHRATAPSGVMDALFAQVMLWGAERGYAWFSLGMAPLAGLQSRAGQFVYRHGEPFYNFQGIRAYKSKFDPLWEPRYLAYPGGLAIARVATDVASLVAGGYVRIFLKPGRRAA